MGCLPVLPHCKALGRKCCVGCGHTRVGSWLCGEAEMRGLLALMHRQGKRRRQRLSIQLHLSLIRLQWGSHCICIFSIIFPLQRLSSWPGAGAPAGVACCWCSCWCCSCMHTVPRTCAGLCTMPGVCCGCAAPQHAAGPAARPMQHHAAALKCLDVVLAAGAVAAFWVNFALA